MLFAETLQNASNCLPSTQWNLFCHSVGTKKRFFGKLQLHMQVAQRATEIFAVNIVFTLEPGLKQNKIAKLVYHFVIFLLLK